MNITKTGRAVLLAALNRAAEPQGYRFSESDLTFSAVSITERPGREVEVTYAATPDSIFEGQEVAYYNRLDLGPLFANAGYEVIKMAPGAVNVGEVVEYINDRFSMGFTEEDFDFDAPVGDSDESVVLTALPGSYAFKGQLEILLVEPKIKLSDVVLTSDIDLMEVAAQPQDVLAV